MDDDAASRRAGRALGRRRAAQPAVEARWSSSRSGCTSRCSASGCTSSTSAAGTLWALAIGTSLLCVIGIGLAGAVYLRHRVPEARVEPLVLRRALVRRHRVRRRDRGAGPPALHVERLRVRSQGRRRRGERRGGRSCAARATACGGCRPATCATTPSAWSRARCSCSAGSSTRAGCGVLDELSVPDHADRAARGRRARGCPRASAAAGAGAGDRPGHRRRGGRAQHLPRVRVREVRRRLPVRLPARMDPLLRHLVEARGRRDLAVPRRAHRRAVPDRAGRPDSCTAT